MENVATTFMEDMNRRVKRLGIIDVKLAQGAAIFVALVLVKLVPRILDLNLVWFVILAVLCAIKPTWVFFGREPGTHGTD